MSSVTTVIVTYEISISYRDKLVAAMREGCVACSGGRFESVDMSNHEGPKGACADVAIGVFNNMVISTTRVNWLESIRKWKDWVMNVQVIVHEDSKEPKYYKLWPEGDSSGS